MVNMTNSTEFVKLDDYNKSGEWEIKTTRVSRLEFNYICCPHMKFSKVWQLYAQNALSLWIQLLSRDSQLLMIPASVLPLRDWRVFHPTAIDITVDMSLLSLGIECTRVKSRHRHHRPSPVMSSDFWQIKAKSQTQGYRIQIEGASRPPKLDAQIIVKIISKIATIPSLILNV